jgi:alkylation response protein AidB-like acyl-CoA dehydrogenase
MAFFQTPPTLSNTFEADRLLRAYLARLLPEDARRGIEPELLEMGRISAELHARATAEGRDEPRLVSWDAWGQRIDRIEVSPLWRDAERIAAEKGVVATAYERRHGRYSRVHQFSLVYLFEPSTHVYSCPLAMTDGAARTLIASGNQTLVERAVPRLTARDPARFWTSGQWMTERTGGSDVAISETVAKRDGDRFRLYGTKWFTSATTSQMALTLARPEGGPPGGAGLALFYLETRDAEGRMNGIVVNRLKDKLGTRMVPTAELTLDGTVAVPVAGLSGGIKNISPMLTVTRTWNSIAGVAGARRGLQLALDYAKKRVAFGAPLAEKPLHADTLAGIAAELDAATLLAFRAAELMGAEESKEATEEEQKLLRLVVPLAKLTTGKQAVALASELVESFGGAGYVEDTGLPRLVRDAQVLPIWEGTTNVLALDVLRAMKSTGLEPLEREIDRLVAAATAPELAPAVETVRRAVEHARAWIGEAMGRSMAHVEAGARRFALTLGRALELSLLVDLAAWELVRGEKRTALAARRFARSPIDLIPHGVELEETQALLA